jgi:hypothetical protein
VAKYLISFPSAAMVVPDDEWKVVDRDAHAVIGEAKAAGVYAWAARIAKACRCDQEPRVFGFDPQS